MKSNEKPTTVKVLPLSKTARFLAAIATVSLAVLPPAFTEEFLPESREPITNNWAGLGGVAGTNDDVTAIAVDESGDVYVAGWFTMAGTARANHVARWDGRSWWPLGSGIQGDPWQGQVIVRCVAARHGIVYVGGYVDNIPDGVNAILTRWDGHSWSTVGGSIEGNSVLALAFVGDDLYVGGEFTKVGDTTAKNIAKWDGSTWSALGEGTDSEVYTITAIESDVYVGGNFNTAGGINSEGMARWNGSEWTGLMTGLNGDVLASTVLHDDLYVGGSFLATNEGVEVNFIARWDGSEWSSIGSPAVTDVMDLAVWKNQLFAVGQFDPPGSTEDVGIVMWDGEMWSQPGAGIKEAGDRYDVSALAVSDSGIYAGGQFVTAGGVEAGHIAKWNGNEWIPLGSSGGPVAHGVLINVMTLHEKNLYVAYRGYPTRTTPQIQKWDGASWSPIGPSLKGTVRALAFLDDTLYFAGNFTILADEPAKNIARWTGDSWEPLGAGVGLRDNVQNYAGEVKVMTTTGNSLIVGGVFDTAGEVDANSVAKWDGSAWAPLGSGFTSDDQKAVVYTFATSEAGLFAGGRFTEADGVPVNNVARWDGTRWSPLGPGLNDHVFSLAASGTDLYAGRFFTATGEVSASGIAKWNGETWEELTGKNVEVVWLNDLKVVEGRVYAAGAFADANGYWGFGVSVWTPGDDWSRLTFQTDEPVDHIAVEDQILYAAGKFTEIDGVPLPRLARHFMNGIPPLELTHNQATVFFRIPEGDYSIERSNGLGMWEQIATRHVGQAGGVDFIDTDAPSSAAFYRSIPMD